MLYILVASLLRRKRWLGRDFRETRIVQVADPYPFLQLSDRLPNWDWTGLVFSCGSQPPLLAVPYTSSRLLLFSSALFCCLLILYGTSWRPS